MGKIIGIADDSEARAYSVPKLRYHEIVNTQIRPTKARLFCMTKKPKRYDTLLMGIQGQYFKRWLPKVSSKDTNWKDWKKKHPNSLILK